MLKVGDKAPEFELQDKDKKTVKLSDFLGRKAVVYFYPKDNTPGCTREACAFAGIYKGFVSRNVSVIGISKDSVESHRKFAEKYNLPFVMLSDPERKAIEAFGVWKEKKLYGKTAFGINRSTFIVNEQGIIEKIYEKANPDTNAKEILDYLDGAKQ
jgi:peroxiredoxin Q/BCP